MPPCVAGIPEAKQRSTQGIKSSTSTSMVINGEEMVVLVGGMATSLDINGEPGTYLIG
jgi:hypothetical protein